MDKYISMQAQEWSPGRHGPDWLWSEKLDGVRGTVLSDGIYSRYGNKFAVPAQVIALIKDRVGDARLDGEFMHPDGREKVLSTIKRKAPELWRWPGMRFCVFDLVDNSRLSERCRKVHELLAEPITGYDISIAEHPKQVIGDQNPVSVARDYYEGIVLVDPNSYYVADRSWSVLKVKNITDAEGVVTGYVMGTGKHYGRLGSLVVATTSRSEEPCSVSLGTGFSDTERTEWETRYPMGSKVTFQHRGWTRYGIPQEARFLRVWSNV